MNVQEIEIKVKELIAEELAIAPADISSSATFEELKADSLAMLSLVLKLEDAFSVVVEDDAVKEIKTVQDVIARVHRCKTEAACAQA